MNDMIYIYNMYIPIIEGQETLEMIWDHWRYTVTIMFNHYTDHWREKKHAKLSRRTAGSVVDVKKSSELFVAPCHVGMSMFEGIPIHKVWF